ncbi:PfkB family carbohydrate kinase [Pseudarthrobacter sp. AL20]|uniref:PfkB family carbohydrate kinase n=1 Tax=unclassified Pseudarthrobacter TaxID=2647000 RepID=UPI0032B79416
MTSIDTVGAGDAFTAGYLSALLDGEDVAGRLRPQALTTRASACRATSLRWFATERRTYSGGSRYRASRIGRDASG